MQAIQRSIRIRILQSFRFIFMVVPGLVCGFDDFGGLKRRSDFDTWIRERVSLL
jgi:hypothetical protein